MKIIELRSENFKRLTAVTVRPDGSLVQITGKNGAGKSSLLDSIYVALAGKSAAPKQPIRKGQKKATIRLDLGELIVTREFRAEKDGDGYTTSLTVESKDGAQFRSPQTMLDALLGSLSFDPLLFARAPAKEQVDMLKALVPGFDFDEADRLNAADYEKRRDVNRRVKELRAQAEGIDAPEDAGEPIDETALVDELEKAGEHNADIETRKANRARLERDAAELVKEADAHEAHAADLRARAEKAEGAAKEARDEAVSIRTKLARAEALPEPVDTSEIRAKIASAREHNEHCKTAEHRRGLEAAAERLEEESETLSAIMGERNAEKALAIQKAKLPVPGLAFGSGEVTLAGVPFEQGSDAEQLRASCAIAAALNPKLRVIRIRDGSLLDTDGLALVAKMADEQDFQVWVEKVSDDARVGIHIVDGAVAEKMENDQ
jgi:DNA repair exonuclease SbcCD ATPase subunit